MHIYVSNSHILICLSDKYRESRFVPHQSFVSVGKSVSAISFSLYSKIIIISGKSRLSVALIIDSASSYPAIYFLNSSFDTSL